MQIIKSCGCTKGTTQNTFHIKQKESFLTDFENFLKELGFLEEKIKKELSKEEEYSHFYNDDYKIDVYFKTGEVTVSILSKDENHQNITKAAEVFK